MSGRDQSTDKNIFKNEYVETFLTFIVTFGTKHALWPA